MRKNVLIAVMTASLLLFGQPGFAAEKADAKAQLQELVSQINAKLKDAQAKNGKVTEADLGEDLEKFDSILEQHKGEKSDDVAQILFMQAMLYLQVLENTEKGMELVKKLKSDFPETKQGQNADKIIVSIQKQQEAKKIQESLVVGAKFPDFDEKDIEGKPLSVAGYKGKVVLVDFWATWCGPCIGELPNVLKTYEKYHGKGFEIIGISLDREEAKLKSFVKEQKMSWQHYFDGQGWQTKLAEKYGIQSIPATFLLDGEGKIIAKDQELRGSGLETQVGKILDKP